MWRADDVGHDLLRSEPASGIVSSVVAIPVNNERERIVTCLDALAGQVGLPAGSVGVLLFLNNCTDGTRDLVEDWLRTSPMPIRIVEENHAAASAGWARRKAMDAAAAWLADASLRGSLLLTTDADSSVPTDWIARNRAAMAAGADAVAGRVLFDPAEMVPSTKWRQDCEAEYEMLLAEIEARLAPQHGNPWPCHWTKSGASIAVSPAAYRAVGGMPALRSGEDRAFVDLLRSRGFVVRHAADIVVTTSGRIDGRACGGAADTLRRWTIDAGGPCDERLQRLGVFVWGVMSGRRARGRVLHSRDLPRQIARARLLLRVLRGRAGDRADRHRVASTTPDAPKRLFLT